MKFQILSFNDHRSKQFGIFEFEIWILFGVCLPAGRQGICNLGFIEVKGLFR